MTKTSKMACAPSEDRSAWAYAESDQSLRCALSEYMKRRTQGFFMRTAKTDHTGWVPRLFWVFDGCTGHFVGFDMLRLISSGINGPRQANLVLLAYASSEGSGEPAHPRSLARTSAARSYKQWVKGNLQTETQIHGLSGWLGMRSLNLSWRTARRHKFAWRGPNTSHSWWKLILIKTVIDVLNKWRWTFQIELLCLYRCKCLENSLSTRADELNCMLNQRATSLNHHF